MLRSHAAGSLRESDASQQVTLAGWVARRRDHGGVIFIDLRDVSGVAQVVFREPEVLAQAHRLRAEFCVAVSGVVEIRPEGNDNPEIATGGIEVNATSLTVLGDCAPLPFQLDEPAGEELRLKYRYLDLRRDGPAAAIRLRSQVNAAAREVLARHGFVEIETPTITRSTPEGARDFLVPARLRPGTFYALPQSPQLFKQLLMVAGMERYYQIARCYRDEDFRADRQPEFTQLDIEMSFVDQEDVIEVGEAVVSALWALKGHQLTLPLPRLTYAEAMDTYGSDKPDLRFGLPLSELTDFFTDTTFRVFQAPYVGAVVMPGGASQPRRTFDAWQEWAKQRGAKGLAYVTISEDGELGGPVAKNITDAERAGLADRVGANPGDCIFFAAGARKASQSLLGAVRNEIAKRLELIDPDTWSLLWVVDAPLFEPSSDAVAAGDVAVGEGAWTAVHHAFTSPKPESIDTIDTDPGSALAYAYDIVCNGNEIGGGS
ncbi:aspartate--tRNA ligase, partial [Mycobacterium sp.]|uniref:aspartate--tRNA ligase n=1 Tax=Mycobacterium sp. TaxID=1785 RepID=UPI003A88214F